jgi:NAD(P)-dependent dehydrogenase (short-subunit alcohol dehydrogenase family)
MAAAAVLVCLSQAQPALSQQRAGIGAGFAKDFVESGAKVVLADANLANANKIADQLNQGRDEKVALPVHCDVTSYGSTLKAFQAVREASFNPGRRIDFGVFRSSSGSLVSKKLQYLATLALWISRATVISKAISTAWCVSARWMLF